MRFVSNIPDSDHVPYPVIEANPHIKTLVRYFRPSDYAVAGGIGVGFPLLFMLWERRAPSIHPRLLPRVVATQVPFFLATGLIWAGRRSYERFWGWRENSREVARWEAEREEREAELAKRPGPWHTVDW